MFNSSKKSSKSTESGGRASSGSSPTAPLAKQNNRIAHFKRLLEGKRLSVHSFDLHDTVGTGTFGRVRVVKLKGSEDRSPMALKMLKKSEVIRLKQVDHVKAEKSILSMIEHPYIVNLLTSFQDDRRLYMLMEYVNGGELFSYLRKEGRLSNDHAKFYAAEILLAFQYLHDQDIIYRDLKPENLLIDSSGHVKVTDFGFAKIVDDRTWTLCGTPEYLAPEIIQSKGHGKSVDWWALGILIFEMLAGFPPFYHESSFGIYQKILAGKYDFPRHFDIKGRDLIKRLLTHDRSKRFGCLKNGAEDIKKHKWFKGVEWNRVMSRELPPPYVPKVKGEDDTSMFDKYPESAEGSTPSINVRDQALFEDF
ncbi:cAMP-dependent protein kinase catalytic subunit, putative [Perkinsus marinus ATCC 50983]|uniref:cAMP-dependent protein kinase catalytic subunit, putative n=1 Tax=Perkinsus marinus (strain ATCC 50983 / TXsc) TaxID=423536 RepID=C5KTV1_PERM5|nr:cAMP-dependent protein kinase catalytic subunit, putative [Perkinsus marinus ATCC 50983]EER11993.1 cAMP-dependent protein kinase catalytic subunit, putative [Perkinsus marinus ATCC 50983]|eukprot:XP_002780198.1 cAMP-dependent protein kinase catalytic subunit, putative [Perkinsus marinus ATCC 50983]